MADEPETLGRERLRLWRNRRGITQLELALRLGVTEKTYGDYERGVRVPKRGKLMTVAFADVEGHITPHMLRHLFASECYEDSGGDLILVQNLLGHAQPSSTAIYTAFSRPKAARVVRGLFSPPEAA